MPLVRPPLINDTSDPFQQDVRRAVVELSREIDSIDVEAAEVSQFTVSEPGTVPASGGGTANFLRADGTWAVPPGGAGQPYGGAVVTPAPIAGTTNDWDAFGGNSAASIIRGSTTGAAQNVTGITGGSAGRVCILLNVGATGNLALKREDAGSAAGNRFAGPAGAGDVSVTPGGGLALWYDGASSRWRPIRQ